MSELLTQRARRALWLQPGSRAVSPPRALAAERREVRDRRFGGLHPAEDRGLLSAFLVPAAERGYSRSIREGFFLSSNHRFGFQS